jgi:hypothetical protein
VISGQVSPVAHQNPSVALETTKSWVPESRIAAVTPEEIAIVASSSSRSCASPWIVDSVIEPQVFARTRPGSRRSVAF